MFNIEDLFIYTIDKYMFLSCSINSISTRKIGGRTVKSKNTSGQGSTHRQNNMTCIIKDIPNIIQFNTLSKNHYRWIKKTKWYQFTYRIIKAYEWLKVQNLRKSANLNIKMLSNVIEHWACINLSQYDIEDAVLLYNILKDDIIFGKYPCYNINTIYIYPYKTNSNDLYKKYYKNYF